MQQETDLKESIGNNMNIINRDNFSYANLTIEKLEIIEKIIYELKNSNEENIIISINSSFGEGKTYLIERLIFLLFPKETKKYFHDNKNIIISKDICFIDDINNLSEDLIIKIKDRYKKIIYTCSEDTNIFGTPKHSFCIKEKTKLEVIYYDNLELYHLLKLIDDFDWKSFNTMYKDCIERLKNYNNYGVEDKNKWEFYEKKFESLFKKDEWEKFKSIVSNSIETFPIVNANQADIEYMLKNNFAHRELDKKVIFNYKELIASTLLIRHDLKNKNEPTIKNKWWPFKLYQYGILQLLSKEKKLGTVNNYNVHLSIAIDLKIDGKMSNNFISNNSFSFDLTSTYELYKLFKNNFLFKRIGFIEIFNNSFSIIEVFSFEYDHLISINQMTELQRLTLFAFCLLENKENKKMIGNLSWENCIIQLNDSIAQISELNDIGHFFVLLLIRLINFNINIDFKKYPNLNKIVDFFASKIKLDIKNEKKFPEWIKDNDSNELYLWFLNDFYYYLDKDYFLEYNSLLLSQWDPKNISEDKFLNHFLYKITKIYFDLTKDKHLANFINKNINKISEKEWHGWTDEPIDAIHWKAKSIPLSIINQSILYFPLTKTLFDDGYWNANMQKKIDIKKDYEPQYWKEMKGKESQLFEPEKLINELLKFENGFYPIRIYLKFESKTKKSTFLKEISFYNSKIENRIPKTQDEYQTFDWMDETNSKILECNPLDYNNISYIVLTNNKDIINETYELEIWDGKNCQLFNVSFRKEDNNSIIAILIRDENIKL